MNEHAVLTVNAADIPRALTDGLRALTKSGQEAVGVKCRRPQMIHRFAAVDKCKSIEAVDLRKSVAGEQPEIVVRRKIPATLAERNQNWCCALDEIALVRICCRPVTNLVTRDWQEGSR